MGYSPGEEPLTRQDATAIYEALGWKFSRLPSPQLKGENLFFLYLLLFYCRSFHVMMHVILAVAGGGNE